MATIVVVDDESLLTDSLKFLLENEGHAVHVASNGRQALDLIARVRPAVVVTDLMMPVMSGLELAASLRADEHSGARLPIILCSAAPHAIEEKDRHLFSILLQKPCPPAELLRVVARYSGESADEH
jgi:CheY-like chemotaxis protein